MPEGIENNLHREDLVQKVFKTENKLKVWGEIYPDILNYAESKLENFDVSWASNQPYATQIIRFVQDYVQMCRLNKTREEDVHKFVKLLAKNMKDC